MLKKNSKSALLPIAFSLVSPLLALMILDRGVDWTDEGFYLNAIRSPGDYVVPTFFGHVFNPVFDFLGGDLVGLRFINVLLILCSGIAFATILVSSTHFSQIGMASKAIILASVASSSILLLRLWLPSPSYNSLNAAGLYIFGSGLLLTLFPRGRVEWHWIGPLLLGLGLGVSGVAKPTSGALLYVAVLLMVVYRFIPVVSSLLITSAAALPVSAIILSLGGPVKFIENLSAAAVSIELLDGGQFGFFEPFRWLLIPDLFIVSSWLVIAVLMVFLYDSSRELRGLNGLLVISVASAAGVIMTGALPIGTSMFIAGESYSILPLTIAVVLAFVLWRERIAILSLKGQEKFSLTFMIVAPLIYSFGTNNNYISSGLSVSLFWVASIFWILVLRPVTSEIRRFSIIVSSIVILTLTLSISQPYRQAIGLVFQNVQLQGSSSVSSIKVDSAFASKLEAISIALRSQGFHPGDALIDDTGNHPALAYLLEARHSFTPWILKGYRGAGAQIEYLIERSEFLQNEVLYVLSSFSDNPSHLTPALASLYRRGFVETSRESVEMQYGNQEGAHRDSTMEVLRLEFRSQRQGS